MKMRMNNRARYRRRGTGSEFYKDKQIRWRHKLICDDIEHVTHVHTISPEIAKQRLLAHLRAEGKLKE